MEPIYYILIISVLGPIIGSAIGVWRQPSEKSICCLLAFAAGVMLAVSFLELIPESIHLSSVWLCGAGFMIGGLVMFLIDKFFVGGIIPNEGEHCPRWKKTALYLIFGIFIHNLPEGIAIATGTVSNGNATLMIALAIAIQNIPEGICTSAPYYHCTGQRLKAFLLSSSTAIPILVGFFLGYVLFKNIPEAFIGAIVALVAGVMVYISCDELIPCSCNKAQCNGSHKMIASLLAGVLLVICLGAI